MSFCAGERPFREKGLSPAPPLPKAFNAWACDEIGMFVHHFDLEDTMNIKMNFKRVCCFSVALVQLCLIIGWLTVCAILHMIEEYISILHVCIFVNAFYIVLCGVLGSTVLGFSIDHWFVNAEEYGLTVRERMLLWLAGVGIAGCGVLFIMIILYHNLQGFQQSIITQTRLSILLLTVFNIILSYAAYQCFQWLKEKK